MTRMHVIVAAGVLGFGGASLWTVQASAFPWGHDQSGTNMQSTNCNCAAGEPSAPAKEGPQVQAAASRQGSPAGIHNNTGERAMPQR